MRKCDCVGWKRSHLTIVGTEGDEVRHCPWCGESLLSSFEKERQEAIVILRSLCEEFGDNDWGDDLHLADIIDKHLRRHLI